MWSDRVSTPGPLALESDALPTALCGPAQEGVKKQNGRVVTPEHVRVPNLLCCFTSTVNSRMVMSGRSVT